MKILLLSPPFIEKFSRTSRSPGVSKGGCVYYPIWLAYATGALINEKHEVLLLDASGENLSIEETIKKAKDFEPEMIVIDSVTPSFENDCKVAEQLKKETNAFIVFVGTHPSALPEETLKECKSIDAVAIKEYDFILVELAKALEKKKKFSEVKGIAFRDENKIVINEDAEEPSSEKLEKLPFASEIYKRFLKVENYFYPSVRYPQITILTGRGCRFRCAFCVWPQVFSGHNYRIRSPENVVKEFKWIEENLPQVKEVMVEDDTLTQDRERTIAICKKMIEEKVKLKWSCNARCDVPLDVLQWMKKAGCRLMCVGIESASQEILNNIHKGITTQQIRQFFKDSKKAGILIHGCFMVGNNGETKETIKQTAEFARELNPDTAQFFPIMVYPGTEAYKWANQEGFLKTKKWSEWLNEDGTHRSLINRPGLSAQELVEMCNIARKKFYMRPSFVLQKFFEAIKNPKEFPRLAKGGITFAKYLFRK